MEFSNFGYRLFARNTQLDFCTIDQSIKLSEALETVLAKGCFKTKNFHAATQRTHTYLLDACRAKNLAEHTRADALNYWDYLITKGPVGSSVCRVIISIRAVFKFAISKYALELKNHFVEMYFNKTAW